MKKRRTLTLSTLVLLTMTSCVQVRPVSRESSTTNPIDSMTPSSSGSESLEPSISDEQSSTNSSEESNLPTSEDNSSPEDRFPLLGIAVESPGPTQFFRGDAFSANGLVVIATYANGAKVKIDNNRLIFSGIDLSKAGVQTLTITYMDKTASYQIAVLDAKGLSIEVGGFDKKANQRGECASNFTTPFGLVYQNKALDTSNIRIHVSYEQDGSVIEGSLPIEDSHVRLVNFTSESLGQQEAKISVKAGSSSAEASFPYSVTNALPYINRGKDGRYIECRVDPAYEGMEGAIVVGTKENAARGYSHQFKKISRALDFIRLNNIEKNVAKNIILAPGDYNEKVDVTEPFVSIIGKKGETKIHSLETISSRPGLEKAEETYVLAVRDSATYFHMEGVSLANDALDIEEKGEELFATSLLCQADCATFLDCAFSGVDQAVILHHGRRQFKQCDFVGRNVILRGTSTSDLFSLCNFTPIQNTTEKTFDFLALDGAGSGGLKDALELCATFDSCIFNELENSGKYALSTTDSPYTRINFLGCIFPPDHAIFGESIDTFFPSGAYPNTMESIHFGFYHCNNVPQNVKEDINKGPFDKVNGNVVFPYEWNGWDKPNRYEDDPSIYLNFDGFSYRSDAQQTVLAHDLNLPESEEEAKVNDVLSLYPVKGIHFDEEKDMTFFAKDSYLRVNVPVGSRVELYSEIKEGSRYTHQGFAKVDGEAIHETYYIYRPVATFYANGNVGEMSTMTFKAMGDSYLKFIVITPNAMTSDEVENPTVNHRCFPTSMYVCNYVDSVYPEQNFTPKTIFSPFRDNIWLEYGNDGYTCHVASGYNKHVHASLIYNYDGYAYDELEYSDSEDWYLVGLTGGKGGTIHGDVLQQYYNITGNGINFYSGSSTFQSIWLGYLFDENGDSKVSLEPSENTLAWRRMLWISYSAPKDYRSTLPGSYDFTAANQFDDASDHEFILEDYTRSAGYSISTGDSRVCAYDSVNGGLRLEGAIEYRWKLHSLLKGGKLVVKAKKGSSLSARLGEATSALSPAAYSTPDYDYFEYAIPQDGDNTLAIFPGEAGATLYNFEFIEA